MKEQENTRLSPKEGHRKQIERWIKMEIYRESHKKDSAREVEKKSPIVAPDFCIQIATDVVIEMEKVTNLEQLFEKAKEIETHVDYQGVKYKKVLLADYQYYNNLYRYSGNNAFHKDDLNELKNNLTYDLTQDRIRSIGTRQVTTIGTDSLHAIARISQRLTKQLTGQMDALGSMTIIPHPKYL